MTDVPPAPLSPLAARARSLEIDLREMGRTSELLADSAQFIGDALAAVPIDPDPVPDPPPVDPGMPIDEVMVGVVTEVAADLTPVLLSHAGIAANWFTNVAPWAVIVDLSGFRLMPGAEPKPSIPVGSALLVVAGQPWEATSARPAIVHRVDVFGPPATPPAPASSFELIGGMSYGNGPRTLTGPSGGEALAVSAVAAGSAQPGARVSGDWILDSATSPQFDLIGLAEFAGSVNVGAEKHIQSAFVVASELETVGEFSTGDSAVAEAVAPAGSGECMIVVAMGGATAVPGKISDAWTRVGGTGPGWVSVFAARGPAAEGETVRVPLSVSDSWSAFIVRAV